VLISALAIAEKTLKMLDIAVHYIDDDPGGMVEVTMNGVNALEAGGQRA
jgi:hypothetical protein